MDEEDQEEADDSNAEETEVTDDVKSLSTFFLKLLNTTTVDANYDELPIISRWITTFLRQAYCSGCCGLFTAPFVTGMADLYRKERECQYYIFYKYLGSYEQTLMRYYEFQIIGLLVGGICAYNFGRRISVILSNVLLLTAVLVIGSQVKYIEKEKNVVLEVNFGISLLLGVQEFQRLIFGIYVAEVTNSTFRAFFMAFFYFSNFCATYSSIPFDSLALYKPWQDYNTILASGILLISCLVPETPFWLAYTGQREEAAQRFRWIRAGTSNEDELTAMLDKAELVTEQRASVKTMTNTIFSKEFVWCLMITTSMLFTIKNLTGLMSPMLTFDEKMRPYFKQIRDDFHIPWFEFYHTRLFGTFMRAYLPIFGISIFMVSNFFIPRKVLFLGSIIMQTPLFFTYYIKYSFSSNVGEQLDEADQWRAIEKAHYLYYLYAYIGAIPVSTILPVEIFPAVVREIGVLISYLIDCSFQLLNSIIVWYYDCNDASRAHDLLFVRMTTEVPTLPKVAVYVEYVLLPVGLFLSILLMPETKDMTLDEVEEAVKSMKVSSLSYLEEESVNEEQIE